MEPEDPELADLRPYSRRIIMLWAGVTAVVLPLELALTLLLSATLFVSFSLGVASHYDSLQQNIAAGNLAGAAVDVFQALLLVVLLVGLAYALCFLSYRMCQYQSDDGGRDCGPASRLRSSSSECSPHPSSGRRRRFGWCTGRAEGGVVNALGRVVRIDGTEREQTE